MSIYWDLFLTYIKIGLFNFGGGYAMLPLIQHEVVDTHGWITQTQFADIVAISQITPGPIGINSATYIGYTVTGDVWGAVIATFGVCLPSFVIILSMSILWKRYKESMYLKAVFSGVNPVVIGLIASAALLLSNEQSFIDYKSVIIFAVAIILSIWDKISPVMIIMLSALAGFLLY